MRLRLQEADRQRLGCPEFLPISLTSITNKEAIELKKLGFPTVRLMAKALEKPGEYEAWTALVWLALKRSSINVAAAELEFALPVEVLGDEEAEAHVAVEGKAEEAPEASTS